MAGILLFCTAEEAMTVTRKTLNTESFWFVDSKASADGRTFRRKLADDESLDTEFIGSSVQECRQWALDNQFQNLALDQDFIAIADQRSARDDTLSIHYYRRNEGFDCPPYGILPRESNKWYEFRVMYEDAFRANADLSYVDPWIMFPYYFGRTDEFTDERGVFDVRKAAADLVPRQHQGVSGGN